MTRAADYNPIDDPWYNPPLPQPDSQAPQASAWLAASAFFANFVLPQPATAYVDNSVARAAYTTSGVAAAMHTGVPFATPFDFRMEALGLALTAAPAASFSLVYTIYGCDDEGLVPTTRLYQSAALATGVTSGYKGVALDFTTEAGALYYLFVSSAEAINARCINTGAASLSLPESNSTGPSTMIQLPQATPLAPEFPVLGAANFIAGPPLSFRMKPSVL